MRSIVLMGTTLIWVAGCATNLMEEPIEVPASPPSAPAAAERPRPPPGSLFRSDVDRTVEAGLGYFLQRVAVEPELEGERFKGFRIVGLRPPEFWEGVDLKTGDVVQGVNGMPIERDIDAYKAFESLRAASALRVTFTRGGAPRELVFSIVDDGKPAPKAAPPAPPTPGAAPPPAVPVAPDKAPPPAVPAAGKTG